jgi:predicted dithiol-disulfide oxidoreductase (DUF899 family)
MQASGKTVSAEITALEKDVYEKLNKLGELKRAEPPEAVKNYTLKGADGTVELADLFSGHDDLIVVHNMGKSCPYCTLWADGFSGVAKHLASRAGFALVSPDPVSVQQDFKQSRNWRFPVYSAEGSSFIKDMGFESENGGPEPGMSTFVKRDDGIYRIASSPFGPMDPFAGIWHMFALLENGADGWQPKYTY